jgi:hypothetical protein
MEVMLGRNSSDGFNPVDFRLGVLRRQKLKEMWTKPHARVATAIVAAALLGGSTGCAHAQPHRSAQTPGEVPGSLGTSLTIMRVTAPAGGDHASVRLSCSKGEAIELTCRGTVAFRRLSGALLGHVRFAIPNCCAKLSHGVKVRLNRAGQRLLDSGRQVRVRAIASLDHNEAHETQTVLVGAG